MIAIVCAAHAYCKVAIPYSALDLHPLLQMPLEIDHREQESIQILDLKGSVTIGPEDAELRANLESITGPEPRLLLNLSRLHELDSTGLGTLLLGIERLREKHCHVAVYSTSHAQLPALATLETVLHVFTSEQDAIASFFPERAIHRLKMLEFLEAEHLKCSIPPIASDSPV